MASALTIKKLFSNLKIQMFDHDPDGTSAAVVTPDAGTTERWVDMRDYGGFAALAMVSALTGNGITKAEIVANTASDGSGTTVVIKDSGTVAADAVGDYVALECTAEELAQLGAENSVSLRYVALRLTLQNAADECVATYILHSPAHAYDGLTATTIS